MRPLRSKKVPKLCRFRELMLENHLGARNTVSRAVVRPDSAPTASHMAVVPN
jgi:hypothetical protein